MRAKPLKIKGFLVRGAPDQRSEEPTLSRYCGEHAIVEAKFY
jgi:hypothetical protein